MGVRAQDRGDPPVEEPAERDLLARRLRVDVDQQVVDPTLEPPQRGLGLLEEGVRGVHVEVPGQVDDAQAHAVAGDDRLAPARLRAQVVARTQHPVAAVEVAEDLPPPVGVVAERDDVDAGLQKLVGETRRDPQPAGHVLGVDHDERRPVALAQGGQHAEQRPAPRAADEVAGEEDGRGGIGHGCILSRTT